MEEATNPEGPSYLLSKLARGEQIYRHEVIDVVRFNPEAFGELHGLLLDALEGRLNAKPGPKDIRSRWDWQCIQAAVECCAADIVDDRKNPSYVRTRDARSPKEQAYEDVARQFRLSGRGSALLHHPAGHDRSLLRL